MLLSAYFLVYCRCDQSLNKNAEIFKKGSVYNIFDSLPKPGEFNPRSVNICNKEALSEDQLISAFILTFWVLVFRLACLQLLVTT